MRLKHAPIIPNFIKYHITQKQGKSTSHAKTELFDKLRSKIKLKNKITQHIQSIYNTLKFSIRLKHVLIISNFKEQFTTPIVQVDIAGAKIQN